MSLYFIILRAYNSFYYFKNIYIYILVSRFFFFTVSINQSSYYYKRVRKTSISLDKFLMIDKLFEKAELPFKAKTSCNFFKGHKHNLAMAMNNLFFVSVCILISTVFLVCYLLFLLIYIFTITLHLYFDLTFFGAYYYP